MVSMIDAGIDRQGAQPLSGTQSASDAATESGFKMFGEDGFTFRDFLDLINPLQHIPVVSTVYRALTGDHLDPGSKIIGSTILGGPVGAALSIADVAVKHNTGKDVGEHVAQIFTGEPDDIGDPPVEVAALNPPATPATPVAAPQAGTVLAPGESYAFADRAAAYLPPVLPDLGLLTEVSAKNIGPAKSEQATDTNRPRPLEPVFPLNDTDEAIGSSRQVQENIDRAARILDEARTDWVYDKMIKALDQYQRADRLTGTETDRPGGSLSAPAPVTSISL